MTYGHDVQEHATHVVTVSFVCVVVHMAVVVKVWCVSGRVVHLEVIVVAELVIRRDGGNGALGL